MSQFLCLMPVYNHRQDVLESAVQCFLDQTLPGNTLLIGDDRPEGKQLDYSGISNVIVYKMPQRAKHTLDKYNQMLTHARRIGIEHDAVAMWDDDDLYLPHHLNVAANLLHEGHVQYTWPGYTFDAYQQDIAKVETGGRFWASMTIKRTALERIGGFSDDGSIAFDQRFMAHLHRTLGLPARSLNPSYIYRWGGTNDTHVSAMSGDPTDTTWWERCRPADVVGPLKPQYDPHARRVIEQANNYFSTVTV